jgi:ABC-type bacteriocin/lantibiotic exporter with double-glycine peptidase domain
MGVARALYRHPRLLVLDEATSALDSATEEQLLQTVAGLPTGITVVYVSHRTAVLDYVSQVLQVRDGEVLVTVR